MSAPKKQNKRKVQSGELKRRFDMWLLQHAQALLFSLGQYLRYPINHVLTTAVIGISLALPASFYVLLENVRSVSAGWDGSLQVTLFMENMITDEQTIEIAEQLNSDARIESTNVIKRADALAEYRSLSGFADALNALDDNPLPSVIIVHPAFQEDPSNKIEALIQDLEAKPEIDNAQYDSQWIQRLFYLLDIINRVVVILSTLLAAAVLLVIGNTIRLAIFNRRSEIEISKLFGGTDAFIQRPFLYSGLWYGIFGSLIAWILIFIALQLLRSPVNQLASLYGSQFELSGLGFANSFILLVIGVFLGLAGSWISVKRHLRAIEPA